MFFSDILYHVPISTNSGTYISWYNENEPVILINDDISLVNFYLTNNLSYTPLNLQGLDFSFSFTIIETLQVKYESLASTTFLNQNFPTEPVDNTAETQQLVQQRDDALQKLDVYRKKLNQTDE